jgi:hypothetical protein
MENQFKGTPGPWHLSIPTNVGKWAGFNTAQGKCYGIYAANDDLEAVAMVFKDDMLIHKEQNALANATLIGASPDMYEALIAILDAYEGEDFSKVKDAMEKGLAAISKATL